MCLGVASELHHKPGEINLKGGDQFSPVMLPLWPSHPALRSRDPSGVKSPPGTAPVPLGAVPRTGRDPQTPLAVPGVCLCLGGCARDTESWAKEGAGSVCCGGTKHGCAVAWEGTAGSFGLCPRSVPRDGSRAARIWRPFSPTPQKSLLNPVMVLQDRLCQCRKAPNSGNFSPSSMETFQIQIIWVPPSFGSLYIIWCREVAAEGIQDSGSWICRICRILND